MQPEKLKKTDFEFRFEGRLLATSNPLVSINECSIIFICMWVSWPYINYRLGFLPFLALLFVWFLTTDYRWIFRGLSLDLLLLLGWAFTFLPYILTGNFRYGEADRINILISFTLFIGGIFINHYYLYYQKNVQALGRIALFTIIFYFIASIQTYLGLKAYPLAARLLATGTDQLQQTYNSLGIGDFGFVYSAVFLNMLLLYFVIPKADGYNKSYKLFMLVVFFMIITMLISASYFTSLLLLCLGTIAVVLIKGSKSLVFFTALCVLLMLVISRESIGYFLLGAADLFESNIVIKTKFLDLAQGFLSNSFGDQTSGRGELYLNSIQTFLKNPLFGIYGPFGNEFNSPVGGHSGWFDLLAYYGLFGSLPLYAAIFLTFRKQRLYYVNHPYYRFLLTAQILFIIFGFINPIIYIYQMGFILFAIAPAIPFLPYAFSGRSSRKGESG